MLKKILYAFSIIITLYSCTASKDSSTTDKTEKKDVPVKPATMDRDSKGNYLK